MASSTDEYTRTPLKRAALVCVVGAVFVGFSPEDTSPAQWLLLAAGAGAAAYLLNSLLIVLLPAVLLAGAHTDLGSPDPGPALWYPVIAAVSGLTLAALLIVRAKGAIERTREARRAARLRRLEGDAE